MASVQKIVAEYTPEFHNSTGFKVLDLFCCSGVAAEGYIKAGASVLGVDKYRPTFYPAHFLQEDFLNIPADLLRKFDFVHMSPPCQGYSVTKGLHANRKKYDLDMISQCRSLLESSGVAGVIENVVQAPLRKDFMLCGSMFGLQCQRHRVFECVNWQPFYSPRYCAHDRFKSGVVTAAGESGGSKHLLAEALGTYACRTRWELCQGVPPAYTKFILDVFKFSVNKSPGAHSFSVAPHLSALPVLGNKSKVS